MAQTQQIQELWRYIYDLLHGPGRAQTYNSFLALTPRFDEELLNEVSALKAGKSEKRAQKIENIRGRVGILQATGLLGEKDLEKINIKLDEILGEE